MDVALPTLVMTPVRLALVVTVSALPVRLPVTLPVTAPVNGPENVVALTVPVTSRAVPGHAELIPTLPPPLTIKLPPAAVHVPMPTFPLVTAKKACAVVVPNPTLPVNVLVFDPLWVYAAELVMAVVALVIPTDVTAPAAVTLKALIPTAKGANGAHVPIPTLPLVITKAP